MRHLILILLFSVGILHLTEAQDLQFGVKAGINISGWKSNADDVGAKIGYHFGVTGQVHITDDIDGLGEILLSGLGVGSTDKDNPGRSPFNYLSIPLGVRYSVMEALSIHGGIQLSYLFAAKTIYTSGKENRKVDIIDEFSKTDFSLILGGEYNLQENILLGLRLTLAVNNIGQDGFEARNQVFQLFGKYLL